MYTNTNRTRLVSRRTRRVVRRLVVRRVRLRRGASVAARRPLRALPLAPVMTTKSMRMGERVVRRVRRSFREWLHGETLRGECDAALRAMYTAPAETRKRRATPAEMESVRASMSASASHDAALRVHAETLRTARAARRIPRTFYDYIVDTVSRVCSKNVANMGDNAPVSVLFNMRDAALSAVRSGYAGDEMQIGDIANSLYLAAARRYHVKAWDVSDKADTVVCIPADAPCKRIVETNANKLPAGYTRAAWLLVRWESMEKWSGECAGIDTPHQTDAEWLADESAGGMRVMLYAVRERGAGARPIHGLYSLAQNYIRKHISTYHGRDGRYSTVYSDGDADAAERVSFVRASENTERDAVNALDAERRRVGAHAFIERVARDDDERVVLRALAMGETYRRAAERIGRSAMSVSRIVERIRRRVSPADAETLGFIVR